MNIVVDQYYTTSMDYKQRTSYDSVYITVAWE